MKRRFRDYLLATILVAPLLMSGAVSYGATPQQEACAGIGGTLKGTECVTGGPAGGNIFGVLRRVANTLILVVLAVSVIMVIIGGLRYVLSGGDSAGIKSAKDTIMYALVGVAIAIVAYAIVSFVVNRVA